MHAACCVVIQASTDAVHHLSTALGYVPTSCHVPLQVIAADLERKQADLLRSYQSDIKEVADIFATNKCDPALNKNSAPHSGALHCAAGNQQPRHLHHHPAVSVCDAGSQRCLTAVSCRDADASCWSSNHSCCLATGAVAWVRGLLERIEEPMAKLKVMHNSGLDTELGAAIQRAYVETKAAMAEYERSMVEDWCKSVAATSEEKLNQPLLQVGFTAAAAPVSCQRPAIMGMLCAAQFPAECNVLPGT